MRKTKIIATLGPACSESKILQEMFKIGLSAVRINTAHISPGDVKRARRSVDSINALERTHVGLIVDLKGPELRTGEFKGGAYKVSKGKRYKLSSSSKGSDISLNNESVFRMIKENDVVLMSDGMVQFKTIESDGSSAVVLAVNGGTLRDRSRVNIPGRILDLGTVTNRDKLFIDEGIKAGVEFFALSFVQSRSNVLELQKMVLESGGNSEIVSKIETKSGLQNIKEIARSSAFVMVARGDLGVELPLEEVSLAQKKIIFESHNEGVPTIVATQILESMVNNTSPTRAEVSDVTNAIMDNVDALMLSEETAIGKNPVEAVKYLTEISEYVDPRALKFLEPRSFYGNKVAFSISMASKVIATEIDADGILVFTKSGNTAKMISQMRPRVPIYAAVTNGNLANKLNLLRGVTPIIVPTKFSKSNDLLSAIEYFNSTDFFSRKARLVVVSGAPYFLFGGTNDVRIVTMGKFLGRGYPSGKNVEGRITNEIGGKGEILIVNSDGSDFRVPKRKFKAVIFTNGISIEIREALISSGTTVLTNTSLITNLKEGHAVSIDGETGVITG